MNKITLDQYIEFQIQVAARANSNMPESVAEYAKMVVDKVLEMNDTTVHRFEPATSGFRRNNDTEVKES